MRHTPRQPRDDVNISRQHPLAEAGTLIAGLGAAFVVIVVLLVYLVDIVLYFVPAEQEARMFDAWLPDDIATVSYDDPRLVATEALLERLVSHWPDTVYDFRVEIDDSSQINAGAFPGGLIIVTSGLLELVGSENELAFVLAHELGHFRNRDHIRGLGRGVALGMLFTAIGIGQGNAAMGATITDLALRGFSRRQEASADEYALGVLNSEYGHVAEAWRFFERIDDGTDAWLDLVTYTSTHPAPADRIERIIKIAAASGWSIRGEVRPLPWENSAPQ